MQLPFVVVKARPEDTEIKEVASFNTEEEAVEFVMEHILTAGARNDPGGTIAIIAREELEVIRRMEWLLPNSSANLH